MGEFLMTVKDRLRLYLEFARVSQSEFERCCGLSHGYVANIRKAPSSGDASRTRYPYKRT